MPRKSEWRKKPVEQWGEREQLDFCRHLMEPVIELMAVRMRACLREAAKWSANEAKGSEMRGKIGTCSICGGDVIGHVGPWLGVVPPPPGRCSQCGAVEARGPVIPMRPATPNDMRQAPNWIHAITDNTKGGG